MLRQARRTNLLVCVLCGDQGVFGADNHFTMVKVTGQVSLFAVSCFLEWIRGSKSIPIHFVPVLFFLLTWLLGALTYKSQSAMIDDVADAAFSFKLP